LLKDFKGNLTGAETSDLCVLTNSLQLIFFFSLDGIRANDDLIASFKTF
jgi:hypothetical protein